MVILHVTEYMRWKCEIFSIEKFNIICIFLLISAESETEATEEPIAELRPLNHGENIANNTAHDDNDMPTADQFIVDCVQQPC